MENKVKKKYNWPVLRKEDKESEKVQDSIASLVQNNLSLMRASPNRAKGMRYFEEILSGDSRVKEIQLLNTKIIGIFCNFIPEELIHSAGAIPIRLCSGFYETIETAEKILPRDICPLIKSSFGALALNLPYFNHCSLSIIPTPCDGKKRLAELFSDYIPVWTLELPQTKNLNKSFDRWLTEIRSLKKRLESFVGVKISKSRLKSSIKLLHKRTEVFRRLHRIRKINPPVINGRDVLLVIQSAFYDDPERWIEKTTDLCNELEGGVGKKTEKPIASAPKTKRLLLTGAPLIWPNFKILNIIEASGAVVVADELCSGTRYLYDPVEVDEWTMDGMLMAMSARYLYPSTCPCFPINRDDRIDAILRLVDEFSCQGVIYHNMRLCQLYDIEQGLVKKVLLDKGIPMLSLQTDYSSEDLGPLKNRVEAFLEMLES
ncbi:MAG: double-cubane-cluster-containing anaerobic reductase [Planctomycetota bacterium]|nr:double-cubane-cluster-containing anaerobic reductase [Planctomycetota bacterium]